MMDRQERMAVLENWFAKTSDLEAAIDQFLAAIGSQETNLTRMAHEYVDVNISLLAKVTGIDEDWLLAYEELVGGTAIVNGQIYKITDIPSFLDAVEADEKGAAKDRKEGLL